MTQTNLYPKWKDTVVYASEGPGHRELMVTDTLRTVLVGLEAGQQIPPHAASAGAYHFLKGSGWMTVDGVRLAVEPGATVVVPNGSSRGVSAETRLAFLGAMAAMKPQKMGRLVKYGPLIMFGLMIVVMIVSGLMFLGEAGPGFGMLRMMMSAGSGGLGLGLLGAMLVPVLGMLTMFVLMFVFYRKVGAGGPMSAMMGHHHAPQARSEEGNVTAIVYDIPAISCAHCKMTIEREVGKLAGVASVDVDESTKQAVIRFGPPATQAEIEALLAGIGYPPQSQQVA